MKKQRTNNPRFLGALGFMGALAFHASQNPEVRQWARLSLLSLISLLVLLPTMDVNSKEAAYRLNPRRKWALMFLVFLGFLGFLFSEQPNNYDGLAMLALISQFAIDHRKKAAVPLKELRHIFALMFVSIILPIGGMLWFMSAAIRNEQVAVRQRLTEVYESQLDAAVDGLEESIGRQRAALARHAELPPARRFAALVRDSVADSILVLDENGQLAYPANPSTIAEAPSTEALSLKAEVCRLLKAGSFPEARQVIDRMAADAALSDARDESGRLILPALQLFYVQSAPEAAPMLDLLQKTATDYGIVMPSPRRLFYLQALSRYGVEVEPWLAAETLAAELEDVKFNLAAKDHWLVPGKDVYLLFSEDRRTAAVFNGTALLSRLQEQVDASSSVKGVRIQLARGQNNAWLAKPLPILGNGWFLNLHIADDDPFAASAERRVTGYFFTAFMMIGMMSVACGLLVRSLLAQQRLTRMKNDFVATVTHELKTPLASTRLLVDTLLEGRCRDDQQERDYLELIARENKRLSRLIDNFLTFSRMERNKRTFDFEDVEPAEIVEAVTDAVQESYERLGCQLTVDTVDGLPLIVVDKDAMVTVLLNLLDNACKYSDDDKRIELKVYEEENAVCFRVKDNGIGMPKRELSKIMDRFYQVDQSLSRKCGGAGLGLSIVSFIVEAHGAAIDIQSELGKGSAFTVKIPINGGLHGR